MEGAILKRLLRVAIVTSPIIGLLAVSPTLFFTSTHRPGKMPPPPGFNVFFAFCAITAMVGLIWLINIALFVYLEKHPVPFFKQKNRFRYIISMSVVIGITSFAVFLLVQDGGPPRKGMPPMHGMNPGLISPFIGSITNNLIVLIIIDLVVLQFQKSQVEYENSQLVLKNALAEQEHLKQQLNPHFLFNSLTTLNSLIRTDPKEAEDYLMHLSGFLRVSIAYSGKNTIALQQEMALATDYLEMQRFRFQDALYYEVITSSGSLQNSKKVVPLFSVQLLLENAIKHNAFTRKHPMTISIELCEDRLTVTNNKIPIEYQADSLGIGLSNLSDRYKHLSDKEIVIKETPDTFSVVIFLLDDAHSDY